MKKILLLFLLLNSFIGISQYKVTGKLHVDIDYCHLNSIRNHPALSYLTLANLNMIDTNKISYKKFLDTKYLGINELKFESNEPIGNYYYQNNIYPIYIIWPIDIYSSPFYYYNLNY